MTALAHAPGSSGEWIELPSSTLLHGALDWAMAQVLAVEVTISSNGTCWLSKKPNQQWSPHARFRQGGKLLDEFDVQLVTGATTGGRVASIGGEFFCTGPDTLIAMCRVIVTSKLGEKVMIPAVLANALHKLNEEAALA